MKKIILFINSTFNKRDYNRFGIEILKRRGFDIEIWDFTPMFREEYLKNYTPPDYLNLDFIFPIASKEEFFRKIKNLEGREIAVDLYPGSQVDNNFKYDALKKYNVRYGINLLGTHPELGLFSRLQLAFELYSSSHVLKLLLKKLIRLTNKEKKYIPYFILCGDKKKFDKVKNMYGNNINLVLAHTWDYDLFLKEEENPSSNTYGDYAVFLDQILFNHPDAYGSRIQAKNNYLNVYYKTINKFFDKIERDLKLKVIIASHPRRNEKGCFNGRMEVGSQTLQLVRHSKLVIAHYSLSIGFAVLYKKPIIFVADSNRKYLSWYKIWTKRLADELGNISVDMNKINNNIIQIPKVNIEKYNLYQENYIKMKGTPEKNTWEIFADYCETLPS
jgi:hypothetical protein